MSLADIALDFREADEGTQYEEVEEEEVESTRGFALRTGRRLIDLTSFAEVCASEGALSEGGRVALCPARRRASAALASEHFFEHVIARGDIAPTRTFARISSGRGLQHTVHFMTH